MFKAHNLFEKKGSAQLMAKTVKRGAWKGMRILFVAAVMLAFCAQLLGPTQNATADIAAGFSEYFVPGYSDDIAAILIDLSAYTSTTLTNVITMPITTPDLIVYYDHWENGYLSGAAGDETYTGYAVGTVMTFKSTTIPIDVVAPVTPRNPAALCAGSINPAGTTTDCYDGKDRIFIVGGAVSMSQVFWPTSTGTVYAHAWEIYPVKPWETNYVIPIGENLYAANPTAYADYDCVYVLVEAWYADTHVTFDNTRSTAPASGACGVNLWQDGASTLAAGTTYFRGGVYSGSTIVSDKPVEVQMIVGREDSTYDSRSHTLVPSSEWNHEYFSPVPSYGTSQANLQINGDQPGNLRLRKTATETGFLNLGDVLHYNYAIRNDSYLTIIVGQVTVVDNKTTVTCPYMPDGDLDARETTTCTDSHTITAADILAGFVTNIATSTIGTLNSNSSQLTVYYPTSVTTGVNIYMYNPTGSPLAVTYQDLVGTNVCTIPAYGTMSVRDSACANRFVAVASGVKMSAATDFYAIGEYDTGSSSRNWGFSIIPASSLRSEYFVPWAPGDYNVPPQNNGSPVFVTPTVNGQTFYVDYSPITSPPTTEFTFNLDLLQVKKIRDADNDNSGMHVWSDFPFALTWGEDAQYAGTGNPYIDAGYTINPPNADWIDVIMDVDKSANPEVIAKLADQEVEFRVDVNTYEVALDNVFIEDYLPPYFAYVPNTTNITWSGIGSPFTTEPVMTGNAAAGYTLHWGTAPDNIGDMGTDETMTLTFKAKTVTGFNANSSTNNTKGTGYMGGIALSSTAAATVIAGIPSYITVIKDAVPESAQDFAFTLVNQDKPDDPTSFTLDDDADGALSNTVTFGLRAGTYTVTEGSLPAGWDMTGSTCVSSLGGDPFSPADIPLVEGETVTCTFTNLLQMADVAVTKSDGNVWAPRGASFKYTITVTYPTSELTNQTATNVVMVDTLDLNVSYNPGTLVLPNPNPLGVTCIEPATGGGGTLTCTAANMAEGTSYNVKFYVQVLETAPIGNLIEFGDCTQNPNKQGALDVDVCNLVSVSTDTAEYSYTNNNDSEPKDVGKSTAVTLIDFNATGAKKSIILSWETVSETDNAGFNLYRATSLTGKKVLVNEEGMIESLAAGNPWGAVYEYVDDGLNAKKVYFYWLEDVDVYGTATLHGPVKAKTK